MSILKTLGELHCRLCDDDRLGDARVVSDAMGLFYAVMREAPPTGVNWLPIETAPTDRSILLWWRPKDANPFAEDVVIGQVSSHELGKWWNGQRGEYQDVWHVTHWAPLPSAPEGNVIPAAKPELPK
jgi:hypothetical protein